MIIDVHTHVVFPGLEKETRDIFEEFGDFKIFLDKYPDAFKRFNVERLINDMNLAGVDMAAIMPICNTIKMAKRMNDLVSETVTKFPDKLIGFACTQPDDAEALDELERAVKELGLKGLKLAPPIHRCYIDSSPMLTVIDKAVKLKIPILIHCDNLIDPSSTYSHPGRLVHSRFFAKLEGAEIILAHLGGGLFVFKDEKPVINKFCLDTGPKYPLSMIHSAVKFMGVDRILFGSDWAMGNQREEIEKIKQLEISEEDKVKILGENAAKMLNI